LAVGTNADLWLIDTETQRRVRVPGDDWTGIWRDAPLGVPCAFSPSQRWFVRHQGEELFLIDTATGAITQRWSNVPQFDGFRQGTEEMVFRTVDEGKWFVNVWDADGNRSRAVFGPFTQVYGVSRGCRFGLVGSNNPLAGGVDLIDVERGATTSEILGQQKFLFHFETSEDEALLAVWSSHGDPDLSWEVAIWDTAKRTLRSSMRVPAGLNRGLFSPRGDAIAVYYQQEMNGLGAPVTAEVQLRDVKTGAERWRTRDLSFGLLMPRFRSDGAVLCVRSDRTAVTYYDVASGEPRRVHSVFADASVPFGDPELSALGWPFPQKSSRFEVVYGSFVIAPRIPGVGWEWVWGTTNRAAVVDAEEGQTLAIVPVPDQVESVGLSEDGARLIACHERDGVWCVTAWDVPPPKSWQWIVGIPIAAGLTLVGLKKAYRGLRKGHKAK
jgi:hypothetical protein